MLAELIAELLTEIGCAAVVDAGYILLEHHGAPCRYIARAECGDVNGVILDDGQTVLALRTHRMIVEPIDQVVERSYDRISAEWSTC